MEIPIIPFFHHSIIPLTTWRRINYTDAFEQFLSTVDFSDNEMVTDRNKRKFEEGKHEDLEVKFTGDSEYRADLDYQLTIEFEEGCSATFDATMP